MSNICPLCEHSSNLFRKIESKKYYQCNNCFGIFLDSNFLPSLGDEKIRYEKHNNDVNDVRYQKFVSPITSRVLQDFTQKSYGLDFGAGTGPVIMKMLEEQGFSVKSYDPFFHNFPELLEKKYDYIACCEVVEHFHHPKKEFKLLHNLLSQKGKLYCMTEMITNDIIFENWYYKNDPTHVFFYSRETMEWIKNNFHFSEVSFHKRLTIFTK